MDEPFKRLVVLADLHCGHRAGLTPPQYQSAIPGRKYYDLQRKLWEEYASVIESLKPIYTVVVNGDGPDGKGYRSGGNEQITTDRNIQSNMAAEAINLCEAEKILITRGTDYHVGVSEDWEDQIAEKVNADKIGNHEWLEINHSVVDIRHFVSASSIPHGRFTAVAKEKLWNILWNREHEQQPDADILIRSHVHYHTFCGDPSYLAITTPALQAAATRFGSKICSGTVHWGFIWFDFYPNGKYTWDRHIIVLAEQKAKPLSW